MARKTIGINLDDNDMNNINHNFEEVYNGVAVAPDTVTSSKIAKNAVNDKHIADKTLNGSKIANGTLTGQAIIPDSITELRIGTRQISHRNLALGAVEDENISANAAIKHTKIDADQFTMSKGKTYPFYSVNGDTHSVFDNAVYDAKIMNAVKGAKYKIADISKNNEGWGAPVTYVRLARTFDNGLNWEILNTRNDNNLDNGQIGINTVLVTNNNMQEELLLTLNWSNLNTGHNTDPLTGGTDYIIAASNIFYTSENKFKKPLKILLVGNSFSTDSAEHLKNICESAGINITIGVSFDSGAGLSQVWDRLQNGIGVTEYQKWTTTNGRSSTSGVLLSSIITDEKWDIVTFQQASTSADDASTFQPYLDNLIDYVKNNAENPDLKLGLNMTWAYAQGSTNLSNKGYATSNDMFKEITKTYQQIMSDVDFDILLPTGTAIQNARTDNYLKNVGTDLTRDGAHLDKGIGRYVAAMAVFEALISGYYNKSALNDVDYYPAETDNAKFLGFMSKVAAKNAVLNPFKVTGM